MEIPKSPKSLAYARLGKPNITKNNISEQQKKLKRNSTGNIYQQILGQFNSDQNKYIRELVSHNQRQDQSVVQNQELPHRRKSYADLVVNSSKQKQPKEQHNKEERQTLCRATRVLDNCSPPQSTPKNTGESNYYKNSKILKSSKTSTVKPVISSFRKDAKSDEKSFLDSLNCYLDQLNDVSQPLSRLQPNSQKLSETLKIGAMADGSYKLVSKLEQSQIKIKELKLKAYYQEKEIAKYSKKQARMKESLYEMLGEIKQLTAELSSERRQRKRLEKVIENFELRRLKPERKTIGKHQLKLEQLQRDLNQLSDNQHENSQFDSSCRQYWRNGTNGTAERRKSRNRMRMYDQLGRNGLNESQIEKMFRSKYHSSESDNQ